MVSKLLSLTLQRLGVPIPAALPPSPEPSVPSSSLLPAQRISRRKDEHTQFLSGEKLHCDFLHQNLHSYIQSLYIEEVSISAGLEASNFGIRFGINSSREFTTFFFEGTGLRSIPPQWSLSD